MPSKTEIRMNELLINSGKMPLKDALVITASQMVSYHFARFLELVQKEIPGKYAKMVSTINAVDPNTQLVSQWI